MAKTKWNQDLEIPFNNAGMMGYDERFGQTHKVKNHIFNAVMEVKYMSRGRSSAKLIMTNKIDNLEYEMFLTDVTDMLKNGLVNFGIIEGLFVFTKRGQNFGVKYLGPNIQEDYQP